MDLRLVLFKHLNAKMRSFCKFIFYLLVVS